jgi:MFS family permease
MFHGWVVVGGAFLVLLAGFGITYSFGTFFAPLQQEFGATRGAISLVFALGALAYFAVGVVSGPLADRFGPRRVGFVGMATLGLGMIAASRASSLTQIYVAYTVAVGIGVGCIYVPSVSAVQRWFTRRRGFATGIAVSGIGVGTLIMPPISAAMIDPMGWRTTWLVLGIAALVVGGGAVALLESSPERRGLHPDGTAQAVAAHAAIRHYTVKEALATPRFWLLYAATLLASFGTFVPFVHIVAYASDVGLSAPQGALLLSLIGLGSTLGRFAAGGAADRVGRRISTAVSFGGMGILLLTWLLLTTIAPLAMFAVIFGLFYGCFVALVPALTADYFGSRSAGGIIGALYSGVGLGTFAGAPLAGYAFDLLGSYLMPAVVSGALCLIAAAIVAALPEPGDSRATLAQSRP